MLHGALGSKAQFKDLRDLLTPLFDVFDFSFEGHGGLPLTGPFSIDRFVNNTLAVMDQEGVSNSHFFGYSMGGYVALKLAHDFPDRVDKVVTLGTKFHWTPGSTEKDVRMMNPDIIEQKIPAFASTLAERHHPSDWKEIMRRTGEMMTRMGEGDAMTENHFNNIKHKTLICIGTQDHMVTVEESEHTAGKLKNGQLKTIEGFKHPLEAVDQNTIASICNTFLSSSTKKH